MHQQQQQNAIVLGGNQNYGAQGSAFVNPTYPQSGQYPPPGQYPPLGQYPPPDQYPPPGQYPPLGKYPPTGVSPPGQYPGQSDTQPAYAQVIEE